MVIVVVVAVLTGQIAHRLLVVLTSGLATGLQTIKKTIKTKYCLYFQFFLLTKHGIISTYKQLNASAYKSMFNERSLSFASRRDSNYVRLFCLQEFCKLLLITDSY